jgi:multimeric flavodoxin WrbA
MPKAKRTILGLIASPRKLGNCEIIVKEIARNVPEPHELKLIRLQEKNIKYCRACYACLESGNCALDDDFRYIADHLAAADGVIIASPCYLMGLNGVLKLFIDRCMQMFSRAEDLNDKPAINIVTAGLDGEAGYTEAALNNFSLLLGLKLQESAVFYGALPGEALWKKEGQERKAQFLATRLFSQAPRVKDSWRCPLCGSDVVQLLGGTRVQCMVCRNFGAISLCNGEVSLNINLKPENILYTAEQRKRHKNWLQEKKKQFLQVHKEMAGFQRKYKDDGEWL